MSFIDWALVLVINLGIVAYGFVLVRGVRKSFDWFVAAKTLPWWAIGFSAFATAVDSGDYTSVAGAAYRQGISQFTQWWVGIAIGWFVMAFFVVTVLYRAGFFTNAEWLEFRFGPATRVLAVLVNIITRANVTGNIYFSMHLVLSIIAGFDMTASYGVVFATYVLTCVYLVRGGLKSGVMTDVLQSLAMIVGAVVLFAAAFPALGGWEGITAKLAALNQANSAVPGPNVMLHVGGYAPGGTPATMVVFALIISLTSYAVINQYEAIRFLGARSEWDFRMAALVAATATAICVGFNVMIGPMARTQFPTLQIVDQAYPLMVKQYLAPGLVGIVVAGIVAAGFSTFDSIGIGISSLFVRDIYARFIVRNREDAHYTQVGRISVPIILALGFLFLPILHNPAVGGMFNFYLGLVGALVVPLMTVILAGMFTRLHREVGLTGMIVGMVYGMLAYAADAQKWGWPEWLAGSWWRYFWNIALPLIAMSAHSSYLDRVKGRMKANDLRGLIYSGNDEVREDLKPLIAARLAAVRGTWLEKTIMESPGKPKFPFAVSEAGLPWYMRPGLLAILYLAVFGFLLLVIFW